MHLALNAVSLGRPVDTLATASLNPDPAVAQHWVQVLGGSPATYEGTGPLSELVADPDRAAAGIYDGIPFVAGPVPMDATMGWPPQEEGTWWSVLWSSPADTAVLLVREPPGDLARQAVHAEGAVEEETGDALPDEPDHGDTEAYASAVSTALFGFDVTTMSPGRVDPAALEVHHFRLS